jgi:hypothetical protein
MSISNKKLLLFALFSMAITALSAQDGNRHSRKRSKPQPEENTQRPRLHLQHELGLNATSLLNKVFRASPDSANNNPYLLTYRLSKRQFGIRVGAGGDYRVTTRRETGFQDSDTRTVRNWDARFGLDYRARLGRRWTATLALDAVGSYRLDKEVNDSGFDVIERVQQFSAWGGGPSIGLAFWFTPRLGIFTEANFYFLSGKNESARRFKNFPELDDQLNTQDIKELRKTMPSSVFLVYKF